MAFIGLFELFEAIKYSLKFKKPKKVLVTGFDSFQGIDMNPSMDAVKAMDTMKIGRKIELMKEKINVRYVNVDLTVSDLLKQKRPDLIIHVGVSTQVKCLILEARARKNGYKVPDRDFRNAARYQNPSPGPDVIYTRFNVAAIRDEFNEKPKDCPKDDLQMEISNEFDLNKVEISTDATRFLCEYLYYTSLSLDRSTLFVHVPPVKDEKQFKQLARGIERIVELCLKQLDTDRDKQL